jgi:Peptidase family M23
VRLRDQSKVLHQAYFTDTLTIDQDNTGKFLTTPTVGSVNGSTAPLPKFYDGFEVPASFSSGKLKVAVNVKLNSACYGDTRDLTVVPAPITVLPHLPYGNAPTSGGPLPLRWHWGNGIGGTGFNGHSTPEHRYCYDINLLDATNSTSKPNSDPNTNSSFYCWSLPILAMDQGTVLFVDDSNEENDGKKQDKITNPANMVVLFNKERKLYYQYVHLEKGGAVDKNNNKIKVGDLFYPGDQIGLMGNAGDSTEPHLHVGIYNLDAQGFLRSLPMTFEKIKDGSGKGVSGVPADNGFYSS